MRARNRLLRYKLKHAKNTQDVVKTSTVHMIASDKEYLSAQSDIEICHNTDVYRTMHLKSA